MRKSDRYAPTVKPDTPIKDSTRYHIVRSPIPLSTERREQLDRLTDKERLQYYFDIYEATFRIGLTPPDYVRDVVLPKMIGQERLSILFRLWEIARKHGRYPFNK
jgi:hypothetical protein